MEQIVGNQITLWPLKQRETSVLLFTCFQNIFDLIHSIEGLQIHVCLKPLVSYVITVSQEEICTIRTHLDTQLN